MPERNIDPVAGDKFLVAVGRTRPDRPPGYDAGVFAAVKRLQRDLGDEFIEQFNRFYRDDGGVV